LKREERGEDNGKRRKKWQDTWSGPPLEIDGLDSFLEIKEIKEFQWKLQ
jgi:hypothetical protein